MQTLEAADILGSPKNFKCDEQLLRTVFASITYAVCLRHIARAEAAHRRRVGDVHDPNAGGGGGGSKNSQTTPQYANYWAPLTRKRHIPPHPAQPQHTNHWAPRTRKRHQQEHRPQRPTESSDPTQHAKGRTGDCPGPRKETTTRRNVTRGGWSCRRSRGATDRPMGHGVSGWEAHGRHIGVAQEAHRGCIGGKHGERRSCRHKPVRRRNRWACGGVDWRCVRAAYGRAHRACNRRTAHAKDMCRRHVEGHAAEAHKTCRGRATVHYLPSGGNHVPVVERLLLLFSPLRIPERFFCLSRVPQFFIRVPIVYPEKLCILKSCVS